MTSARIERCSFDIGKIEGNCQDQELILRSYDYQRDALTTALWIFSITYQKLVRIFKLKLSAFKVKRHTCIRCTCLWCTCLRLPCLRQTCILSAYVHTAYMHTAYVHTKYITHNGTYGIKTHGIVQRTCLRQT